jgi:hypothetical protein
MSRALTVIDDLMLDSISLLRREVIELLATRLLTLSTSAPCRPGVTARTIAR